MNITWNADNDPLSILPGIMIIDVAGTQILWSLICYLFIFICHICWYHHLDLYRFMIIHIYSLCFIIYHICCLYLFNIFDLIYIYIIVQFGVNSAAPESCQPWRLGWARTHHAELVEHAELAMAPLEFSALWRLWRRAGHWNLLWSWAKNMASVI
jgi:hypothetical protein